MEEIRLSLRGNEASEESGLIPETDATTLSWSTRIKGFVVCFVCGTLCNLLSSMFLFLAKKFKFLFLAKGLVLFGVFYTLGNILSMSGTFFLMGPVNQIKTMFAPVRASATMLVIVSFGLTLYAAIELNDPVLVLVFIILQSLAKTWYSLSYIPYVHDAISTILCACIP